MLSLFQNTVDSNTSHEKRLFFVRISEKFGENDNIRIGKSRLFDHVPGHIKLSSVTVIQPKSVKISRHHLDILFHVFPSIRWITWLFSIPDSDQITPNINPTSKVVELLRKSKILSTVSPCYPSVIQSIETFLLTIFTTWNSREIFLDKWVWII